MFKEYLQLIKPKIIFGNLISVTGGFLLASQGIINYELLSISLIGVSLVIASSCILNNIIDRDIDKKMERTKNRVLVKGTISIENSIIYAFILGLTGFYLLYYYVNLLSMLLAIIGFTIYVIVYSFYMKRRSIYSTLVGSIAGATPPVIGYCAVTNNLDTCALILSLIFGLWQIPHSYAIAILCLKDYQLANIPVLPVIKGISTTKNHIIFYIFIFFVFTSILTASGYASYQYLTISSLVSAIWFIIALLGYRTSDNNIWARQLFVFSIFTITVLSIMMSLDSIKLVNFN
ncbi:protoheme IX farnesyltransferase [Candidatus Pantoea edessiphila]|uniref:Protoheme IX farnesyltransferase n=1 Tax=Candidatus Pantoea edessiphila TaxID=2044610 RepID=A0A2P5SZE6_9GAMM|nr:heme o synthase [Candidatus Pantoea edessiphila]PPI87709.1 protoheme IX farnesyltransferase [Candidatus Pantoea edessiphila]